MSEAPASQPALSTGRVGTWRLTTKTFPRRLIPLHATVETLIFPLKCAVVRANRSVLMAAAGSQKSAMCAKVALSCQSARSLQIYTEAIAVKESFRLPKQRRDCPRAGTQQLGHPSSPADRVVCTICWGRARKMRVGRTGTFANR